jgi:hypothetical protein
MLHKLYSMLHKLYSMLHKLYSIIYVPKDENKEKISINYLFSKLYYLIEEYVKNNPEIIYKGIPLVVAIYIMHPTLFLFWNWLPWIWTSYEIYNRTPQPVINYIMNLRTFLNILKNTF